MGQSGSAIGVPLLLRPTFDPKTWGGRRLASLGKALPPGRIGESLESGSEAVVDGGPFAGMTLADIVQAHAQSLLGKRGLTAAGDFADFPLLIKLIDAHEDLSVQVHPDDADAPPGKRGKTEAWYIIDAAPGARIVSGITGALDVGRIGQQLIETTVETGDVYFVPAGTVHAVGAGVLLYEIQQASDVTWRLFDWGRPRELHVEAATTAARDDRTAVRVRPLSLDAGRHMLVACRHFALERWTVAGEWPLPATPQGFRVMTILDGSVVIDGTQIGRGSTVVVPADLPSTSLVGTGVALVGYIPDLEVDVRQPLLAAGHAPDDIRALGADL